MWLLIPGCPWIALVWSSKSSPQQTRQSEKTRKPLQNKKDQNLKSTIKSRKLQRKWIRFITWLSLWRKQTNQSQSNPCLRGTTSQGKLTQLRTYPKHAQLSRKTPPYIGSTNNKSVTIYSFKMNSGHKGFTSVEPIDLYHQHAIFQSKSPQLPTTYWCARLVFTFRTYMHTLPT